MNNTFPNKKAAPSEHLEPLSSCANQSHDRRNSSDTRKRVHPPAARALAGARAPPQLRAPMLKCRCPREMALKSIQKVQNPNLFLRSLQNDLRFKGDERPRVQFHHHEVFHTDAGVQEAQKTTDACPLPLRRLRAEVLGHRHVVEVRLPSDMVRQWSPPRLGRHRPRLPAFSNLAFAAKIKTDEHR